MMTADEIRNYAGELRQNSTRAPEIDTIYMLAEIAAQLAELNQRIGGGSGSIG